MKLRKIQLGKLELATNLLLAPIAGYCDLAFRLVARSCGDVGLACTDLLSPEGLLRENKHSMNLAMTTPEDSPLCMQLYGANVERLCEAARWAEDRGAHVIDINMGCPVDKITKRDGGSKLLCDPDNTVRMVDRLMSAIRHTPLTAKLRLGWDDTCIVAPQLAARLENAGVSLITIHGRTTEMRFTGQARLDGIAEVVAAVRQIPVIGNGDIRTPEDARRMMEVTGCAGVMIGRGALSMPWIFRDTWSLLTTGIIPDAPTIQQKCDVIRMHFGNVVRFRSELVATAEFRKRISWYAKQMNPCRMLRDDMRKVSSAADFESIVQRFLDWRLSRDQAVRAGRAEAVDDEADLVGAA
jgi:nifR3 family TIM-barrel protein